MKSQRYRYVIIWKAIGYLILVALLYFSLVDNPPVSMHYRYADKFGHLLAYGTLMAWFSQLYTGTGQRIILAVIFCLMGILLEYFQDWGGHRYFEVADMLANTLGILLGWWLSSRYCENCLLKLDRALSR
ncbi:VanZ family protein [Kaarinaea lacus]